MELKWEGDECQLWLFDIDEITVKKELPELPHFQEPANDNERLLEFQYQYRHGNELALKQMYDLSAEICLKYVHKEAQSHRPLRELSFSQKQEKAHDAAMYVVERLLKLKDWAIYKSFTGYLYLRVQHELYYQREVDKIVDFVDLDEFYKENEGLEEAQEEENDN